MPPGEYEQFINKNGPQALALLVNMEKDPNRKEDMKLALVDYYRELNPNDQASSDTQILTMLGVMLPQRSDAAPEGAVSAFQSSDYVHDPTKMKLENEYLNLESSIKALEDTLEAKRCALSDIEAKANAKKSDGTYDTDKAKVLQDINGISNEIDRLKKKKREIEPAYNEEKERLKQEEKIRKMKPIEQIMQDEVARRKEEEEWRKAQKAQWQEQGARWNHEKYALRERPRNDMLFMQAYIPPLPRMHGIEGIG